MAPFSVPGILVLPKERKRIGRHKLRAGDKLLPPPVRPPPLCLGVEGTTSPLQARSDPPPPSPASSPPAPHLLPSSQRVVPKTSKAQSLPELVPPGCPSSLPYHLNPKTPTHPCPMMRVKGVTTARLWFPSTKVERERE